jgi:hypothetical protein
MQRLLRDVFRELVVITREKGLWEQATPEQVENLVSTYLLRHYSSTGRPNAITSATSRPSPR